MNNKIMIALGAILALSIISLGVIAYQGNRSMPNYSTDVHAQLEAAIGSGDYDAWMRIRQENSLPTSGRMFQVINKDNFALYAQMHEAMESGDTETADTIRSELGLNGMGAGRMGGMKGSGCQMQGMNSGKMSGSGAGFVDSDDDGTCDNYALHHN